MISIQSDDMPGLFTAKRVATFPHPLHDVAIPDFGAVQSNALRFEVMLKSTVAHVRGDNGITRKFTLLLEFQRQNAQRVIAIDQHSLWRHKHHAVGVPVERDS